MSKYSWYMVVRRVIMIALSIGLTWVYGHTIICVDVDELEALRQCCDHLLRRAMGQTAESEIDARPVGILDLHRDRQVQAAQMRKYFRYPLSPLSARGPQPDLPPRVSRPQAPPFPPPITARPPRTRPPL